MITVNFRWDDNGNDLEKKITKLKRLLSRTFKKSSDDVFFGVLEGRHSRDQDELIPPHFHIISSSCLNEEEVTDLEKKVKSLGFVDFKHLRGYDLQLRKYLLKVTKFGDSAKPKLVPSRWIGFKIPTTFKSGNFLNFKTEEIVAVNTGDLLNKSVRQPHYRRQFISDRDLKYALNPNTTPNDSPSSPVCCYDLKDLKLGGDKEKCHRHDIPLLTRRHPDSPELQLRESRRPP